mgnify:CR=1 FL=1
MRVTAILGGFVALLLATSCQVHDLRPTVRLLKATIVTVRADYEAGRVTLHEHALEARLERLVEAERLAEAALMEDAK